MINRWVLSLFATTLWISAAQAQIDFSASVEMAPPPPRVEVAPPLRAGFIWSPGYWGWSQGRHLWVEGRWVAARTGQFWVPERWVEFRDARGVHWHMEPGHWEREHRHTPPRGRVNDRH